MAGRSGRRPELIALGRPVACCQITTARRTTVPAGPTATATIKCRPDRRFAAAEAAAAEAACRDALDELRRMLGVLRFGAEPLAPSPRLGELADLARAIGATGVNVELSLDGDLDGLPPGVELSCYRIVQEALTNTLKHSGARTAHVSVVGEAGNVRVRVDDDGRGAAPNGHSGGQGLIGMRERAAAYGGTLSAGPQPAVVTSSRRSCRGEAAGDPAGCRR